MATHASRAQAQQWNLNENVKGEVKGMAGKGTNAPRPGAGRRALAEVGNLVEASTQIAGPGKFKEVASKTGVVTRNAARRAGGDAAPHSTNTTTAAAAPAVAPAPTGAKPPAKAKKVKMVGCKVSADPEASKQQEESETSPEVAEVSAATFAEAAAAKKAAAANHLAVASSGAVSEAVASVQDPLATEGDGSSTVTAVSSQTSQTEERLSTSAMLAACSEEACGSFTDSLMTEACAAGPDEEEVDIDWEDHANPLAVTQYVEDIYTFYRKAETMSVVPEDYMSRQADINEKMRGILLDWLIEVHLKFKLMPETLYLTANLIDRYLAITQVQRRNLQLVGVTAMLIASKYEEIWAPEVKDFVYISDNAYTKDQILSMEKHMLNSLGFNLTVPTPYVFAARFMKAMWVAAAKEGSSLANPEVKRVIEMVVWYLLELSLPEYAMLRYSPSMLAASAVYTALLMENRCLSRGTTRAGAGGRGDSSSTTPTGSTASSNIFATGSSAGHNGSVVGDGQEGFTRSTSTNSTCSSSVISEGSGNKTAAWGSAPHQAANDVKEEPRVGNDPVWYAVLLRHTGYTPEELRPCAALMSLFQQRAGTGSLHAVHKKYQSTKFASVARLPLCTSSVDMGVHPLLLAVLPQVAATGGAAGSLAAGALAASAARSGSTVSTTTR